MTTGTAILQPQAQQSGQPPNQIQVPQAATGQPGLMILRPDGSLVPAGTVLQFASPSDPTVPMSRILRFNQDGVADFDVSNTPFPTEMQRTALSIMFDNAEYIADKVMPRVNTPAERFGWRKYRVAETFRRQNSIVGRNGAVNRVEFGYDEIEAKTIDYALEVPIPQNDISNAEGTGYDPVNTAIVKATNFVLLEREIRVATEVGNVNNYARSTVLTGVNRFSDYVNSDPIAVISSALRIMLRRANTMVMNEDVLDTMCRHPRVVQAFNGTSGGSGIVPIDFIAKMFRVQNILVGASWVDSVSAGITAAPGGNSLANLARAWGNNIALLYIDPSANLNEGVTWGMTAQWRQRITRTRFDPGYGLEGAQMVKVGEHVREVVSAIEYGHLLATVI